MTALTSARIPSQPAGFTGIGPLLRVSLRQDIRKVAPWALAIAALSASSILAYGLIFPDSKSRMELARTLGSNPALSLVFGPARDLTTADGFNAWRSGQLGMFFAGMMATLTVVRNSRANEDTGQAELIASSVVARNTRLAVAIAVAAIASIATGIMTFLATVASGGDPTATLVLAATFTTSGLIFTGVAAIAVQLGSDARAASTIGIATLGLVYVLRGYIDSAGASPWVTWTTPLGWLQETRPAAENNPWPVLLALGLTAALIAVGFLLQGRRDFGQGMIARRPGPAHAGVTGTVWGLSLRLNRGSLISWLVAFAGLGLLFGNLVTSIGSIGADNPAMADILARGVTTPAGITFAFLETVLQILAIIAAVMGVQTALRVHSEETAVRVEPLLATSLRRSTYLASNALIALAGPAAAMAITGAALGLVAHARDDTIAVRDVIFQAGSSIAAIWVLVGIALAAVGAAPRLRVLAWASVVATFALTLLGPTFNLPDWVLAISPLDHVPNVTAAAPDWTGLVVLSGITVVLLAISFIGFGRRDVG